MKIECIFNKCGRGVPEVAFIGWVLWPCLADLMPGWTNHAPEPAPALVRQQPAGLSEPQQREKGQRNNRNSTIKQDAITSKLRELYV